MNVTAHFVVPDAAEGAAWYTRAFGAREQSRIQLPGGKLMTVVLGIGESWEQAIAAGATAVHELADQFWGERHGQLTDPFGHRWNIAQHIRDVPEEEIARAAAEAFS
jgi:PhnB protein